MKNGTTNKDLYRRLVEIYCGTFVEMTMIDFDDDDDDDVMITYSQ